MGKKICVISRPDIMRYWDYEKNLQEGIDGKAWHNTEKAHIRETRKYEICKENNIRLIRIKEQIDGTENNVCDVLIKAKPELQQTLSELAAYIPINDINVDRDRQPILENYLERKRKNSLDELYPAIAKQWNYIKNGSLHPNMFFAVSREKVWWVCEKGHEYDMQISERTLGQCGCPYCSNHRLLRGYNDLLTVAPYIAKEWDAEKNGNLSPERIKAKSTYKAYWKCKYGHTWQAKVGERVRRMSGCPECYKSRGKS